MARGWRRSALWLLGCLAVLVYACPGWAQVKLVLDGRQLPAGGVLTLIGTGLGVSAAFMSEELGIEVDDSAWPAVHLRAGDRSARIEAGQRAAVVDGRDTQLQAAPAVHDGMLYVPLHLVADLAGLRVDWNLLAGVLTLERRSAAPAGGEAGGLRSADAGLPRAANGQDGRAAGSATASFRPASPPAPAPAPSPVPSPSPAPVPPGAAPLPEPSPQPSPAPSRPQPLPVGPEAAPQEATDLRPAPQETASVVPDELPPGEGGGERALDRVEEARGTLFDVRLRTAEGRYELVVLTDGPVEPRTMYLPDPDRLVIDLPGASLSTGWRAMPVGNALMQQLRLSSEEGGVRLVVDLTGPTGYTLLPADGHPGFIVRLNHQLHSVSAASMPGGTVALEARVSGGPVPYQAFALREPWRLVVDLLDVTIPAAMDLPVDAPLIRSARVSQFRQDVVRVVLELREPITWPPGGISGHAYPGPDGRLTILLDPEVGLALDGAPRVQTANDLEFVAFARDGDVEFIFVQSRAPLDTEVRRLRDPERIVLDLPGVTLERSLGPLAPDGSAVVAAVRAGQAAPGTGRVVVETRQVAAHEVVLSEDRTRAVLSVRPSQLAGRTVVVDPGHGGRDPGAIGLSGTQEKDVNLAIALEVARYLEQAGARAVLTRDRDIYVDLATRTRLANALRADAFVSIHADAIGAGRTASGTGTFYHPLPGEAADSSVAARFGEAVQREILNAIGLPDRGVRQRAFYVLLHTEMPAVLVEVAFIDNPTEERLLTDPGFQRRAAAGIAQGVLRFFADSDAPAPRRLVELGGTVRQVAAAFLENGDLPQHAVMVTPAASFGEVSGVVAQTQEL